MKTKLIIRTVTGILFLSIAWTLFVAGKKFMVENSVENLKHIPKNANFALRLDGAALLKTSLFSVFLEASDKTIIDAVNEQINKQRKGTGPSKNLGINFLNDVVLFGFKEGDAQIYGLSVNLDRPSLMVKNGSRVLDKNQVFAIKGNTAVILAHSSVKFLAPSLHKKLSIKAKEIVENEYNSAIAQKIISKDSKKIIQASSKGYLFGNSTLFVQSDIDLTLGDDEVGLQGKLKLNPKTPETFAHQKYTLAPNGFHVFSTLVPEMVQDSLRSTFGQFNLSLPNIEAMALNYRSLTIKNTLQGIDWTPDIDLLLTFAEPVDLYQEIIDSDLLDEIGWTYDNDMFQNSFSAFFLKKVNDKTYIISPNKNIEPTENPMDQMYRTTGTLPSLTNVGGDPFLLGFIQMLPVYKATKEFFGKTEGLDITIKNTHDSSAKLEGSLQFKSGTSAINEILRLAIKNSYIRLK